jgi:hypothetical protein
VSGSKSNDLEARLLDHLFKGGATPALTALSTVYVALYTSVPSDSTTGTEVSGSGYARLSTGSSQWTRAAGSLYNNSELIWAVVTGTPYTVVGWAIWDASSGGNRLYWGDCTSTTFAVGEYPRIGANGLYVTED